VRDLIGALVSLPPCSGGAESIDEIRDCEDLKSMLCGRQARTAVSFDVGELQARDASGVPAAEQGKGVAAQVALARKESPARGGRLLGFARAVVTEMPHTLAALESGQLNEWRAMLLVRETACLSTSDRCAVDEELAPDTGTFDGDGDRRITAVARAAAYRRDPRSITQRASHAASERYVSLRPAPDTMTYLTALLPVEQGVAVHAELTRHADSLRAEGDTRTRGQVMTDTLVERATGVPGGVSRVEVQLIMTDRTLLQGDSEPARLPGYGIVPAEWARKLLTQPGAQTPKQLSPSAAEPGSSHSTPSGREFETWLRRLYTAPGSGELVAADSKARLFTPGQRRFIQARDDLCRTPYCDAPIRHYDHIVPWHDDGPTTLVNGSGLCEACNHTKELPGWKTTPNHTGPHGRPARPARHTIELRTPTGHTYRSTAPPLPGSRGNGHLVEQRAGTRPPAPSNRPAGERISSTLRVDLVFA
jgi:hypothetical protein